MGISLTNQLKYQFFKPQLVKFVICGGIAALVNIVARMFLSLVLPYTVAIVIAFIIGMVTGFILYRIFVFQQTTQNTNRQIILFTIVNLFTVIQTLLISLLFVEVLFPAIKFTFQTETIAHCFGVALSACTSFLGHKYWSFAK